MRECLKTPHGLHGVGPETRGETLVHIAAFCEESSAGPCVFEVSTQPGRGLRQRRGGWTWWTPAWQECRGDWWFESAFGNLAPKGDGCKGVWDSETVRCHTRLDFSSQLQIIADFHDFFFHEQQLMFAVVEAASVLQCSAKLSAAAPLLLGRQHCSCRLGLCPSLSCTKAGESRDPSTGVKPSFKGILSLSMWPESLLQGTASEKTKTWETKDSLCTASACVTSLVSNPLSLHALLSDCKTLWSITFGFVTRVRIAYCSYCFKVLEQRTCSKGRLFCLWLT